MHLKHNTLGSVQEYKVIAWHEDATQAGNYILTLQTAQGNKLQSIERDDLTAEQVAELQTIAKDSTGL